jgi:GntR family transcriptional regulator/MocR family aminotransferase
MRKTWAISGVDLHLELLGSRVRDALESALREAVLTGRLAAGARLPSSRSLAGDLGIARNTVAAAYANLVAEGWLEARQGSGTRVRARRVASETPAVLPIPEEEHVRHDFRAGSPDLAAFPRAAWLAAARRALRIAPYEAMGRGDPRGRPELRRALADYLSRVRGVHVSADRIVVCSGFSQGLTLLCGALRARGASRLALEANGHRSHYAAVVANGLATATVPVDGEGAVIEELPDADAVLLTPAHQFPLGSTLGARRRIRAVEWARDTGALVIEDDYDGEFRYDRHPLGAMQALAPESVVYAGTASKSLAPGLRLGWLVLPADLIAGTLAARRLTDGPSTLDQLTIAELIDSGVYDRQVRRSRLAYRRRRDRLVTALARHAPRARVTGIAAGLHALIELPDGQQEDDLIDRARRQGLMLEGLASYRIGEQQHGPALVVGYSTPPEHVFSAAVASLCAVLEPPSARHHERRSGGVSPRTTRSTAPRN